MNAGARPRPRLAGTLAGVAAALALAPPVAAQAPASTSYVLSQSTFGGAGASAVSPSFVLDGTAAQPATVGQASSGGFVLESGFWTSLAVELRLTVAGSGSGRGAVSAPGIACVADGGAVTGDCSEKFVDGTTLGLVAAADPGNRFDAWSGCDATSTTTAPGDTCQVTMRSVRTVTAAFTALGSIGDRVWRDVDGDGIQGAGEPGLAGVAVTVADGTGQSATAVTGGGGAYAFVDVPPGAYTLTVSTGTLPPGVVPTFDLDGVATPHQAQVVVTDGQERTDVDFGYQPLTDLAVAVADSEDPLPGGDPLVYTVTVSNLGPGVATGVTVASLLPSGVTATATSGCVEDPAGVPTCTLGEVGLGAVSGFTLEASVNPAPPASVAATFTVSSVEVDLDLSNNTAVEVTGLDDDPPTVSAVTTLPATADDLLSACETVHGVGVRALVVRFSEPMLDPVGDTVPGDLTNPASWTLLAAGADARFDTFECGSALGDDLEVGLTVTGVDGGMAAELRPAFGGDFTAGHYRLLACGSGASELSDLAGNPFDGDGDGDLGGDFALDFRADPLNLLANGSLDCGLESWTSSSLDPGEIGHSTVDVDGSPDSGSVRIESLSGGPRLSVSQCVAVGPATAGRELRLSAWLQLDTLADGIGVVAGCTFHDTAGCGGTVTGSATGSVYLGDSQDQWLPLYLNLNVPAGSLAARCTFDHVDLASGGFVVHLDDLRLESSSLLFSDGFETGDASAWSAVVP